MIDVVTPHLYAAYSGELQLMFQQRYRVFKRRMGWAVAAENGEERDAFDDCRPIYLLGYDSNGGLAGSWRFLPTTGPYMLRDVFPQLLQDSSPPIDPLIWEGSRFAVEGRGSRGRISSELLCAVTETCIAFGVRELITVYDARMERLLPWLGCPPKWQSSPCLVGTELAFTGRFDMSRETLSNLRAVAGIRGSVIRNAPFLDEVAVA